MWQLATTLNTDREKVEYFLREDYEPFAVTTDFRTERLWFKKKVEEGNEIYRQPSKPKRRKSKRVAPKPKE